MVIADVYGFQKFQQRRAFVPGSAVGFLYYVIAVESRQRNAIDVWNAQWVDEGPIIGHNLVEDFFRKVYLIDRQYYVFDTQQRNQVGMTAGLGDDTGTCVHQNDGQIGGGAAGNHVTGVLFVSRSIGNDELTVIG